MIGISEVEIARQHRLYLDLVQCIAEGGTVTVEEARQALLPVYEPLVSKEEWARHFNDNSLTQSDLEYAQGGLVLGLRKAADRLRAMGGGGEREGLLRKWSDAEGAAP